METPTKLKQRSKTSAKMGKMLEAAHKGFGYEMMELEMTLDNPDITIGASKIQDITQLVQLYMLGVEVLESSKDKKFEFFRKKLQELMKKKIVGEELKLDITEYMNDPKASRTKRISHLQELNKVQSIDHLNQIVTHAEQNVQSCKGIIEGDIRKQQDKIKERLASRSKSKQSGLNNSPGKNNKKSNQDNTNVENQYFTSPITPNKKTSNKQRDVRTQSRENRFDNRRN